MSIPKMTRPVWRQIKFLDPISPEGVWIINNRVKILKNDTETGNWSLVAYEEDPQPPPDTTKWWGKMDLDIWRETIKGGTLNEESGVIKADGENWKVDHEQADPIGLAIPRSQ